MTGQGVEHLQYRVDAMAREALKARAGFQDVDQRICVGPWGCGNSCGEFGLKMVLLWLGAACNGRTLCIHSTSDSELLIAWDLQEAN